MSNNNADGTPERLQACRSNHDIVRLLSEYPISSSSHQHHYSYGTAGFRYDAKLMPCVMVRVGLFVAHRSKQKNGEPIGLMVTASHNDESYNGVKICDPNGGMLAPDGEAMVVQAANEATVDALLQLLELANGNGDTSTVTPVVHIGRDTRSHSEELSNLAVAAARAAGATVYNHGLVTTPCLHHCVLHHKSDDHQHQHTSHLPALIPQCPNEDGYYELLAKSYTSLLATGDKDVDRPHDDDDDALLSAAPLLVDCACGIGYVALQLLVHKIQHFQCTRRIVATNRPTSGPLNEHCGSEHVQKTISSPTWYGSPPIQKNYCASLDGDADRIVFFSEMASTANDKTDFVLLDGDKIACLFCNFLQSQFDTLQSSNLVAGAGGGSSSMPKLGVVQTAYANGASTAYLRHVLGADNVKIAKTGVKHVHTMAHDSFDVGVYFEANGHGTILFGDNFYSFIVSAQTAMDKGDESNGSSKVALERLKLLPQLVNQAVGDALSDLLLVDAILQLQGQTIHDWNKLYQDLPSRQDKVRVRDRTIIKTNDNETKCLEPASVQQALDAAVAAIHQGRAFIRPSGTEDVVRVYAEASTRDQANALAQKACDIIHRLCGGVGDEPPTQSNL